jgi:thioredoxin 1
MKIPSSLLVPIAAVIFQLSLGGTEPAHTVPAFSPAELTQAQKSGSWLVVEFGGQKCIPCLKMQPVLQELSKQFQSKAKVGNFWIADHPDVARTHRVMVMPTQIIFNPSGKEVLRHQGYWELEAFQKALAEKGLK